METIGNGLADQFERMWMMLREAIDNCADEEWKRDAGHWFLIPSRLAYHTVETVDFYSRQSPVEMDWAGRFGADWETRQTDQLPDREPMLDYLEHIRANLGGKLRSMSDQALLADHAFPWTGATVLERMIYTLRHSMFHLGQIQAELRRRGLKGAEWH
jgi:uncharacterized damage-inducible protein DinB